MNTSLCRIQRNNFSQQATSMAIPRVLKKISNQFAGIANIESGGGTESYPLKNRLLPQHQRPEQHCFTQPENDKTRKKDDYIIVNPGSVGQNREFINEINYLIYDSNSKKIDFKSIIYNVNLLIDQMRIKKFPKECIEYYSNKKRK